MSHNTIMTNLKLVKFKLFTDKFSKQREGRNSQNLNSMKFAKTQPSVVPELAITVKIKGFVFHASGNNLFAKKIATSPQTQVNSRGSVTDLRNQDSFSDWNQTKLLSVADDLCPNYTLSKFIESYIKTDVHSEEGSNIVNLDIQAEEMAYEHIHSTPHSARSAYGASSSSTSDVKEFVGMTSSDIFKNLNPNKSMIYQEVMQDSLFEMIMKNLVEKEVHEFKAKRDDVLEMIDPGRVETVYTALHADSHHIETLWQQLIDTDTMCFCTEENSLFETTRQEEVEIMLRKLYAGDVCPEAIMPFEHSSSESELFVHEAADVVIKLVTVDPPSSPNTSYSEPSSYSPICHVASVLYSDGSLDDPSRKVESPKKPSSTPSDELRKLQMELKRAQGEVSSLKTENSQLKDEGLRLRKVAMTDTVSSTPSNSAPAMTASVRTFPPVVYLVAAIIIGLIIGKFIL